MTANKLVREIAMVPYRITTTRLMHWTRAPQLRSAQGKNPESKKRKKEKPRLSRIREPCRRKKAEVFKRPCGWKEKNKTWQKR